MPLLAGQHCPCRTSRSCTSQVTSHGDVIPVLLATLSRAFGIPRPRHFGRGGWYTLRITSHDLAVILHDPALARRRAGQSA
jgi:hypothetical protein